MQEIITALFPVFRLKNYLIIQKYTVSTYDIVVILKEISYVVSGPYTNKETKAVIRKDTNTESNDTLIDEESVLPPA